jgi:hypothetical protein
MSGQAKFYVATAYRLSSRQNHSYVIGVFSTLKQAKIAARRVSTETGYKYGYGIDECPLDEEIGDEPENIVDAQSAKAWDADAP